MRSTSSKVRADRLLCMSSRLLSAFSIALALIASVTLGGGVALATEIAAPRPDSGDPATRDPTATLARWIGAPSAAWNAPTLSATMPDRPSRSFVGTLSGPESAATSLVVPLAAPAAGVGLRLGSIYARNLPALPVETLRVGALQVETDVGSPRSNGFQLVLGSYTGAALTERLAALSIPSLDALAGGTRFDVRPADRNAIALRSPVVERLMQQVVRTPEPSTLALFAAGLAGLITLVRRRRRATRHGSA